MIGVKNKLFYIFFFLQVNHINNDKSNKHIILKLLIKDKICIVTDLF